MQPIENYNCDGLCVHTFCGSRYTRFTTKEINGLPLHLGFCDIHADKYEDFYFK